MKYYRLRCSSVPEECLWMTNFGRNYRRLKVSTRKLFFSILNKIKQDDCCDPAINIHKNNEN